MSEEESSSSSESSYHSTSNNKKDRKKKEEYDSFPVIENPQRELGYKKKVLDEEATFLMKLLEDEIIIPFTKREWIAFGRKYNSDEIAKSYLNENKIIMFPPYYRMPCSLHEWYKKTIRGEKGNKKRQRKNEMISTTTPDQKRQLLLNMKKDKEKKLGVKESNIPDVETHYRSSSLSHNQREEEEREEEVDSSESNDESNDESDDEKDINAGNSSSSEPKASIRKYKRTQTDDSSLKKAIVNVLERIDIFLDNRDKRQNEEEKKNKYEETTKQLDNLYKQDVFTKDEWKKKKIQLFKSTFE